MTDLEEAQWHEGFAEWSRESVDGPDSLYVIERHGEPIGRLRTERDDVVVDGRTIPRITLCGIQLRPPFQRRGIGSAIIRDLQSEAVASSGVVDLRVETRTPTHAACTNVSGSCTWRAMSWRPTCGGRQVSRTQRTLGVLNSCDAAFMSPVTNGSITWRQALAWRLERHLLDPVGSDSVPDVVRRLGAVLAMDESLAELAVRTRCTTSHAGELTQALADGTVIKAFAFRGSMHYLSPEDGGVYLAIRSAGRQWELPSWVEYYRLAPRTGPTSGPPCARR